MKPILLVEDDRVDQMTVKRAMKDIDIQNELIIRRNGEEAWEYLNDSSNPSPAVILLDMNMPKMNGLEFLDIVKKDPSLKKLPVIILTTSPQEENRIMASHLGVVDYVVKPVDYQSFVEIMKTIRRYWEQIEEPQGRKIIENGGTK